MEEKIYCSLNGKEEMCNNCSNLGYLSVSLSFILFSNECLPRPTPRIQRNLDRRKGWQKGRQPHLSSPLQTPILNHMVADPFSNPHRIIMFNTRRHRAQKLDKNH